MMDRTLFQLQQTFIGEETNHTFFYEVEIPAGCERLVIDFGYTPKRLEDKALAAEIIAAGVRKYMPAPYDQELVGYRLEEIPVVNLLTVSLDDPAGTYVGCAHRHAHTQHHEITAASASPGFSAVEIRPGCWRIGLQCHAVVTPSVQVNLCVKGVFPDEVDSN